MSIVHRCTPTRLRRFGNQIRRSLLYILLLIAFTSSIAAQSLDRAAQPAELQALKKQVYASTNTAQTATLLGSLNAREDQFLQPAPEDFAALLPGAAKLG